MSSQVTGTSVSAVLSHLGERRAVDVERAHELTRQRAELEGHPSSSSLLRSSKVYKIYEPYIRALLGTASQFCEVVVLESRTVLSGFGLQCAGAKLSLRLQVILTSVKGARST